MSRFKTGIAIAALTAGALLYLWIWPGSHREQPFAITRGASARSVARELKNARLIGSQWAFLGWVKLSGSRAALRPGVYLLPPGWTGFRASQQLRKGPPLARLTFPEGWTAKQIANLLENRGVTPAQEFLDLVAKDRREGFLFPDTYLYDQAMSPEPVINRMVKRFHEEEPKDMMAQAKALKLSYRQIVILASLVEREARIPTERALIAGVFYNRLIKHMHLESCATVEYALGAWKPKLTYKDLEIESPYNTYKHAGLPPGPICNPGKAALEAAAHPEVTDMLFFAAVGDGSHRFSRTYQEHLNSQKHPKK